MNKKTHIFISNKKKNDIKIFKLILKWSRMLPKRMLTKNSNWLLDQEKLPWDTNKP